MLAPNQPGVTPLPKWHRRASWSLGWAPDFNAQRQEWLALQDLGRYRWHVASGRPVLVAMRLQLLGYELDAVDYGDLAPTEQSWELDRQEPLRWRSTSEVHQPCELCASDDPARRRQHRPAWVAISPAPPAEYQLWPSG
jgi:hypothetical protein